MNPGLRLFIPWRFWPSTLISRWIEKRSGGRVYSGPFAGMRYVTSSVGSSYEPKLLGTYESELADTVSSLIDMPFETVVDVGAAEGYYAVGMAHANPSCQVIAFESRGKGRELIHDMAVLNGVRERMKIEGWCDLAALKKHLPEIDDALLIMDVEGAESTLLDPQEIPALRQAHILVEIHDFAQPGLGELILERFADTHSIQDIRIKPRSLRDYPFPVPFFLSMLWRDTLVEAISEHRSPKSRWFFMAPFRTTLQMSKVSGL